MDPTRAEHNKNAIFFYCIAINISNGGYKIHILFKVIKAKIHISSILFFTHDLEVYGTQTRWP